MNSEQIDVAIEQLISIMNSLNADWAVVLLVRPYDSVVRVEKLMQDRSGSERIQRALQKGWSPLGFMAFDSTSKTHQRGMFAACKDSPDACECFHGTCDELMKHGMKIMGTYDE
jgi:hypothetical protein